MTSGEPWFYFVIFNVFVVVMLYLDAAVFHKNAHEVKFKEAMIASVFWIALALVFNVGVYYFLGKQKALEFLTGYVIEKSLSVDNLFVFLFLFSYFHVEHKYEHKILFWGILGAIVFRGVFIFVGTYLIEQFHEILYIFGVFLVYSGIRIYFDDGDEKIEPEKNAILKFCNITE